MRSSTDEHAKPSPDWLIDLLVGYGYLAPSHPGKWRVMSALLDFIKPNVPEARIVERFGQRWNLSPNDYAQSLLFWCGEKDHWEMYHVRRALGPGAIVLDAGANFGYQAATLVRLTDGNCSVIAVEPDPGNFERLTETIGLNHLEDRINPLQIALSDRPGAAHIVAASTNSGHSILTDGAQGAVVSVTTIDEIAEGMKLARLDAILVDVEGLEDKVIAGGAETIRRLQPAILVELWPPVLTRQGTDSAAVANVLRGLDYEMFEVCKDKLVPVTRLPTTDVRFYAMCFHKGSPLLPAA